jgi:hypothetical protein
MFPKASALVGFVFLGMNFGSPAFFLSNSYLAIDNSRPLSPSNGSAPGLPFAILASCSSSSL